LKIDFRILKMKVSASGFERNYALSDVESLASELVKSFEHIKLWLFEGELGAGKTTLIQKIAKCLNIEEEVNSPTFSLVNEYKSSSLGKVFHLDLYRLRTLEDALEIGLFELVDSGYFCLIEWASAIEFKPAEPYILIEIKHLNQINRHLRVIIHEN